MGIRESLLNTITSVGSSDFVRIVTSAGASSKATVANLFKSFESGLGAKSSLGTSDYIRVVGSDNVSYKQLVSDVTSTLGIKYLGAFSGSTDADIIKSALTALKTAYSSETSSATNTPKVVSFFRSGAWGFVGTAWIRSARVQMNVTQTNSGAQFYASDDNGTQTVIAQPTRAEIDALNSKTPYTGLRCEDIWTDAKTYAVSNSFRAILYITDSSGPRCGEYILATTGTGVWQKKDVSACADITINVNTANQISITPAAGSRRVLWIIMQGTITS